MARDIRWTSKNCSRLLGTGIFCLKSHKPGLRKDQVWRNMQLSLFVCQLLKVVTAYLRTKKLQSLNWRIGQILIPRIGQDKCE